MGKRGWIIAAAVAMVALAGAWYWFSPQWTLHQMKSAAESRDADAFSESVDFPALREDMKSEFMAHMLAESRKDDSGMAELGMALGMAFADKMIDAMISPAGLRAAFAANPDTGARAPFREAAQGTHIERVGLSEFRISDGTPGSGAMIFRRHRLAWKLSGMDIPASPSPN